MSEPGEGREGSAEIADVRGARKVALEKSEESRGSAASPGETPLPTPTSALGGSPIPPRAGDERPEGLLRGDRGRRGVRTGDRGATSGIQISGLWLDVDFNEFGLHVDVVLPVTASCWPREGQRAALGSRRPRRPDQRRKDRRTSRSWVSGAPVAGALGPLPRHPHSPRRLLRLPGASPRSWPLAPGLGCNGRVPARARPLSRADSEPLPAWASPPATGFPATGCWRRRRSGARLPRAPAGALRIWGALGRRGCPESWNPMWASVAQAEKPKATLASVRYGGVHSGAGVPRGHWLFLRIEGLGNGRGSLRGFHRLWEPAQGVDWGEVLQARSVRPGGAHQSAPSLGLSSRRGLGTEVEACLGSKRLLHGNLLAPPHK